MTARPEGREHLSAPRVAERLGLTVQRVINLRREGVLSCRVRPDGRHEYPWPQVREEYYDHLVHVAIARASVETISSERQLERCFQILAEVLVSELRTAMQTGTTKPAAGGAAGSKVAGSGGEDTPKVRAPNGHQPDPAADHDTTQTQEAQ